MNVREGFIKKKLIYVILLFIVFGGGLRGWLLYGEQKTSRPVESKNNDDSNRKKEMYNKLTPEEERVIIHKGTERPFSGKYNNHYEKGY